MSDVDLEAETWIEWFCCLRGNEFLCEVDQSYVEDNFNLYGLRAIVPHYRDCLELLLDAAAGSDKDEWDGTLFDHARDLYGLIHARFIITTRGLAIMGQKYEEGDFGTCPRVYCDNQRVLPVGLSDDVRVNAVKLFCPSCCDIYHPPKDSYTYLDGAYFGTTFPALLLLSRPSLVPAPSTRAYEPRIFGFRVHETANFPRSKVRITDERSEAVEQRRRVRRAELAAAGKLKRDGAGEGDGKTGEGESSGKQRRSGV